MIIKNITFRRRIVKGWAFMDLSKKDVAAILSFIDSGDTEVLPEKFQREDYSFDEGLNGRRA